MKKITSYILSVLIMTIVVFSNKNIVLAAGSISVSASKTTVKVGDVVTISTSISPGEYGVNATLTKSSGAFEFVEGDNIYSDGGTPNNSIKVKAVSEGSCTFSVRVINAFDDQLKETSMSSGSVTITATSASSNNDSNSNKDNKDNSGSNTGNDSNANKDNENKEEKKSSNASLGSLVISAGTLSPEFSAATKDYTATVDYSCSSLAVTANPADSKASVTSVTGNDSLEVGENTVSVVVTAEDGSTSTYNIVVTRRAEDDPENADKQDNWKKFDINGTEWTMVNDIPEDVVPEGFEHSKTVIDGLEYNTLHGTFGDVTLVYLQSESGNGLFVYDAAQNAAYEFVRINSESHFIVVLLPKVDDVPEGYNEISLSIEGKGVATAYQTKVEKTDDQTKDFYLVYAMNDNGESGWYTYDSVDGTYMRTKLSTPTVAQDENDTTKSELVPGIANKYLVLAAILVLIIIILALLLLVVIVKNKKRTANEVNDEEDDTKEFDIEENDIEANDDDAQESAEESQIDEIQEPAEESGEESQIAEILESDENTESTEASDASYVGRTVEITSDLKKTAENEKSDFDSKEASDQENAADDDTLKNQVQMALDGFVNDGNKPSETIDSSAKDDNEDDSEDDDLQFIDLN